MTTPAKDHSRADRLREHAALVETATRAVRAMALVVRGREARAWSTAEPPEMLFARTAVDERSLPAAVWVALRRDDVAGAVDTMQAVSQRSFLVAAREEMGEGYRLQTIEERRPLPEVELLLAQLAELLAIPPDVLAVLADWGAEDPRTQPEIDELLDRRFGAPGAAAAVPEPEPAPGPGPDGAGLTMTVAEAVDVLQLSEAQAKVLSTLVRRVGVTITG
ncbi:MAG: hypothetical protein WBQ18_12485 [Solirubrobacteraceae bacterium]